MKCNINGASSQVVVLLTVPVIDACSVSRVAGPKSSAAEAAKVTGEPDRRSTASFQSTTIEYS
jgi:hypothetical protein